MKYFIAALLLITLSFNSFAGIIPPSVSPTDADYVATKALADGALQRSGGIMSGALTTTIFVADNVFATNAFFAGRRGIFVDEISDLTETYGLYISSHYSKTADLWTNFNADLIDGIDSASFLTTAATDPIVLNSSQLSVTKIVANELMATGVVEAGNAGVKGGMISIADEDLLNGWVNLTITNNQFEVAAQGGESYKLARLTTNNQMYGFNRTFGGLHITNTATMTIGSAGVAVAITNGAEYTAGCGYMNNVMWIDAGTIVYTGTIPTVARFSVQASVRAGNNDEVGIVIGPNGTPSDITKDTVEMNATAITKHVGTECTGYMTNNMRLNIFVINETSTTEVQIHDLHMTITD